MGANQKFVDYFVTCGLNVTSGLEPDKLTGDNLDFSPLQRPYKCHILSYHPETVPGYPFDAEAVAMLCFPKGLSFTIKPTTSPSSHTFIITREDGTRSYGTALTFYEKVESHEICSAMQMLQDMHMAELSNSQSLTLRRQKERKGFKQVFSESSLLEGNSSSKPGSSSDELDSNEKSPKQPVYKQERDVLYCSKCICLLSRLPLVDAYTKILMALYQLINLEDLNLSSNSGGALSQKLRLPVASYIFNLLYEVDFLPAGRSMKILTWKGPVICQRPGSNDLPLLDYALREVFDMFSIEQILVIFSCVLLEHQILLFSKDYGKLMLITECITSLLFPFHWQHAYVPILPASLLHFLDAPVPFIMGLQLEEDEGEDLFNTFSKPNTCVVNIDRSRVGAPEDLPRFPNFTNLIQDITQEIKRLRCLERTQSQRDSGFIRDSYCAPDECGSAGITSSDWNLNAKMEMLQKNEALAKVTALARKSGVMSSLDDIKDSLTDAAIQAHKSGFVARTNLDDHAKDLIFNSSIREIFLYYFLQIFGSYESFVILQDGGDVQSWLNNRETTQNFDKTAFLSDQSDESLPFLAPFIETQMFASFIDQKILTHLESVSSKKSDSSLSLSMPRDQESFIVFESRLKLLKDDLQQSADQRPRRFYRTAAAKEAESNIDKKASIVDIIAPSPRFIDLGIPQRRHFFPTFPSTCFQKFLMGKKARTPHDEWRAKYGLSVRVTDNKSTFKQREEYMEEVKMKTGKPQMSDTDLKAMVNNNWRFMETLLKEVKMKTKRMLVQKMGKEAVELGHGEVSRAGIEENTLIASLCDLLERIWNHGLIQKQDKSAVWNHITSYYEASLKNQNTTVQAEPNPPISNSPVPQQSDSAPTSSSSEGNLTWPIRHHRRKASRGFETPTLEPLPTSVLFDFRNVLQMAEIKTVVGYARAFVRLSLEKKLLSKHLKELFSNHDLLRKLYKRYAFLRCEEEREQFLYHLLSLNAVDYQCFTNTFSTTIIMYRVLIFPRMKIGGGTTSANCWIRLSGQLGDTEEIPLPKHSLDVLIKHKNLGVLTTLRLGHDNSGMSPKWMVEHVLVRNEITGHTYRFPCGRWLGKGVDDGALERLLVAELAPPTIDSNELMERCRTPPRCRSPSASSRHLEPRISVNEIREKLTDAVNNLVKHFCRPDKERGSTTILLCGEGGLVPCMELIFQYGFRSSRLFRNRFFIWDFLEKVMSCFESIMSNKDYVISSEIKTTMQGFCYVVSRINQASEAIGKDERFQILICIGLRDRLLQRWMKLVSRSPITVSMYEELSFLRDPHKLQFVLELLESLKEFKVVLEASIIRGIVL